MDFCVRILSDFDFINLVKCFLYEVYICEMGWEFCEDGLIGFCVERDN